VATRFVLPAWVGGDVLGLGALPAAVGSLHSHKVPESEAWRGSIAPAAWAEVLRVVAANYKRFLYLVVLMVFMMFLSHGTPGFVSGLFEGDSTRWRRAVWRI